MCRHLLWMFLVVVLVAPAAAQDYYPMCPGSIWEYVRVSTGEPYLRGCTGTEVVWGIECAVFGHWSAPDSGLVNYWYKDAGGAVMLRGFFREMEGWGLLYDPAIRMLSGAPFVGEQWCGSFDVYDLPEGTYSDSVAYCHRVEEYGEVVVPAGSFSAFGVGVVIPLRMREQYDLLGRMRSEQTREPLWWYAASVGEVQSSSPSFKLVSYDLPPSRVESASWSRVKALFSGNP